MQRKRVSSGIVEKVELSKKDSISWNRIMVANNPVKCGVIELRRGIPELDIGNRKWAQVRIRVGGKNLYTKGMAIYSDNIPEPYDVVWYMRSGGNRTLWVENETSNLSENAMTIIEPDFAEIEAWNAWEDALKRKARRVNHLRRTLGDVEWEELDLV